MRSLFLLMLLIGSLAQAQSVDYSSVPLAAALPKLSFRAKKVIYVPGSSFSVPLGTSGNLFTGGLSCALTTYNYSSDSIANFGSVVIDSGPILSWDHMTSSGTDEILTWMVDVDGRAVRTYIFGLKHPQLNLPGQDTLVIACTDRRTPFGGADLYYSDLVEALSSTFDVLYTEP